MVVTNNGKRTVALLLGNSGAGTSIGSSVPTYFIIGTGSGTALVTQANLITPTDRQPITTTDLTGVTSTNFKVKWTGDWNAVEVSGTTTFKEWGMILSGTGLIGSIQSRTGIPGITFDGTNELRIDETWEVY